MLDWLLNKLAKLASVVCADSIHAMTNELLPSQAKRDTDEILKAVKNTTLVD